MLSEFQFRPHGAFRLVRHSISAKPTTSRPGRMGAGSGWDGRESLTICRGPELRAATPMAAPRAEPSSKGAPFPYDLPTCICGSGPLRALPPPQCPTPSPQSNGAQQHGAPREREPERAFYVQVGRGRGRARPKRECSRGKKRPGVRPTRKTRIGVPVVGGRPVAGVGRAEEVSKVEPGPAAQHPHISIRASCFPRGAVIRRSLVSVVPAVLESIAIHCLACRKGRSCLLGKSRRAPSV